MKTDLRSVDVDKLQSKLREAEEADVPDEDIAESVQLCQRAAALKAMDALLKLAVRTVPIEELFKAIATAKNVGVPQDDIDVAQKHHDKARALREALRYANDALQEPLLLRDVEGPALKKALSEATAIGVPDGDLRPARDIADKFAKFQAVDALVQGKTVVNVDIGKLELAIRKAVEVNVPPTLLEDARAMLKRAPLASEAKRLVDNSEAPLQQLRDGRITEWPQGSEHVKKLQKALDDANVAGVAKSTLKQAWAVSQRSLNQLSLALNVPLIFSRRADHLACGRRCMN